MTAPVDAVQAAVNLKIIKEIERVILLRLIDSWIRRLQLDVSNGRFSPLPDLLSIEMFSEAADAQTLTEKIRNNLESLGSDAASSGLFSKTLEALINKMKAESVQFEKDLQSAHRKPGVVASALAAVGINERLVLATDLTLLRNKTEYGDFDLDIAYSRVGFVLEMFRISSGNRAKALWEIYVVSGDRESLKLYYTALITKLTESKVLSSAPMNGNLP